MNIQQHVSLAPYTTFHIGGPADFFAVVHNPDELTEAIDWAKEHNLNWFVLGLGANILIGDKGFRGLVIKNEAKKLSIPVLDKKTNEVHIMAESGVVMEDFIYITQKHGLSGLEHFAGIPSTVGGALWQNLHFLSPDRSRTIFIAEFLVSAEILTQEGIYKTIEPSYFQFDYDYSTLHDRKDIILTATFRLTKKPREEIQKIIDANQTWRKEKHPTNAIRCSAGSVFKKIENYGAGRLIDDAGLKGYKIGGAQISLQHANFIINTGYATAKDVRDLITLTQKKVLEKTGLQLEPEISFVGDF